MAHRLKAERDQKVKRLDLEVVIHKYEKSLRSTVGEQSTAYHLFYRFPHTILSSFNHYLHYLAANQSDPKKTCVTPSQSPRISDRPISKPQVPRSVRLSTPLHRQFNQRPRRASTRLVVQQPLPVRSIRESLLPPHQQSTSHTPKAYTHRDQRNTTEGILPLLVRLIFPRGQERACVRGEARGVDIGDLTR